MSSGLLGAVGITRRLAPVTSAPMKNLEPPFELKFLVSLAQASRVVEWAASRLPPDPHAGASREDGYRVTSLYLDTPELDVYHRRGSYGRAKYRLRRYDTAPTLFLERKCKVKGRVRKRRTEVDSIDLELLCDPTPPRSWPGRWFGRRVAARELAPSCLISYERVARVGPSLNGPIRLTVDRDFLCRKATSFDVPHLTSGETIFDGQGVVELKYRSAMPALFKSLIRDLGLSPAAASKYRAGINGCGLLLRSAENSNA